MYHLHRNSLIAWVLGLMALATAGCCWTGTKAGASSPATMTLSTASASTAWIVPVTCSEVADEADPDGLLADWNEVKDYGYALRQEFFAGLRQGESQMDVRIAELRDRHAAERATSAATPDWDGALREMNAARGELKSRGEELGRATDGTWDRLKDRVGQAWAKTQESYTKASACTTG